MKHLKFIALTFYKYCTKIQNKKLLRSKFYGLLQKISSVNYNNSNTFSRFITVYVVNLFITNYLFNYLFILNHDIIYYILLDKCVKRSMHNVKSANFSITSTLQYLK